MKDPRVDAYIDGLPQWQQAICQRLRDLVHAADSQVQETIKRRVQPYFVLEGNICALLAAKDHVNVFLYDGGIVPDPERIITGGHENKTARTVAIYENEAINESALAAMSAPDHRQQSRRRLAQAQDRSSQRLTPLLIQRALFRPFLRRWRGSACPQPHTSRLWQAGPSAADCRSRSRRRQAKLSGPEFAPGDTARAS